MDDSLTTLTRRVIFAPLADPGRTETVASRMRNAITLGIYAEGEQLPNELVLAAQLNISPVTLRDALKVLREEGLVRTTRGRSGGTFVISPGEANLSLFESALASYTAIDLRDMTDWQATISSHAAILATERASNHEIATLAKTAARMAEATDAMTARRTNSRFLIELTAGSRSSRISMAAINLQVEYAPLTMLVFLEQSDRQHVHSLMTKLVEAIGDRDSARARDCAVELSAYVSDRVLFLHDKLRLAPTTRAGHQE